MWKMWLRMALPALRNAGEEYKNKDADNVGKDDLIGASLIYAADLLEAVLADKLPPKAPGILR